MRHEMSISRRMAVLGLLACGVIAMVNDTASAQFRGRGGFRGGYRGGVGVGVGYGGGIGYGGGFGYRSPGYGYRGYGNGYGGAMIGGGYSGYSSNYSNGYATGSYASAPVMMSGGSTTMMGGCSSCDPCATNSSGVPHSAMTMPADPNTRTSGYTPNGETALRVVEVTPQGPAATAGIQSGAIIESVDGQKVSSFNQLQRAVQDTTRKGGTLSITLVDTQGQRHTRYVAVRDNMIGVSVVESNGGTNGVNSNAQPSLNGQPNSSNNTVPQNLPGRTAPDSTTPGVTTPNRTTPGTNSPGTTSPRTTPDTTTPRSGSSDSTRPRD